MPNYEKTRAKANFGSLLKMKDQTFRSVIRKKNLKEFRREDRLPEYLRAEDCEVHPYSGSPRRTLRPVRHNVSPAKSGTRTPR